MHIPSSDPCCFNPRSREGNDKTDELKKTYKEVSIHVPAKGTTEIDGEKMVGEIVSIHVPAKGTTDDGYICESDT